MVYLSRRYLWKAVVLILVLAAVFWLTARILDDPELVGFVARYGYAGIFVVAVFSGFSLLVPVPAASFTSLLVEAGLSLPLVLLIITVGMTIGDCIGFLIGKFGRRISEKEVMRHRWVRRLERMAARNRYSPSIILFTYAAVIPLPNELVVTPLSFLGVRFWQFFLPVLFGNALFNALVAAGIMSIFDLLTPMVAG